MNDKEPASRIDLPKRNPEKRISDGSFCGVDRAARILGDKWTLVLLRDLANGPRRFSELEESVSGISPRTLSTRLRKLEREGLLTRTRFRTIPPMVQYCLTPKGCDAIPVVEALRAYGNRWLCRE
jgi:DNA-binding HxlR family transcriptional regulator